MKGLKTGGRKKGTPNRKTAETRTLEQGGRAALAELAHLAEHAKSEMARLGAIRELLNRCYGKPGPYVAHGEEDSLAQAAAGARQTLAEKLRRIEEELSK